MLRTIDCVVGLGANLGDCQQTFSWTLEQLGQLGQLTALSNLYENPAVGGPTQPDYLNGAVRLATELDASQVLTGLQHIECLAGRERIVKWGPRTLDLDLLWIADQSIDIERLTVPHPRLTERPFALKPFVEVAPKAQSPLTLRYYRELLETMDTSGLRLVATASGPPFKWLRQHGRTRTTAAHTYP